jgi:pyridoxal phosphate enzyme (YggS family)
MPEEHDAALRAALARVHERIDAAAQRADRDPAGVRLVAVTKGVEAARIKAAAAAGVTDIGENRVQEASAKHDAVTRGLVWHLIGHLQTNKAQRAAPLFDAVHSVDSERVARALALHRPPETEPLALLLEVELTGLPGRYGVGEAGAQALMRQVMGLPAVHLIGLMTIAPPVDDPAEAREYFSRLRGLRDRLQDACGWPLPELSMGMSGDYQVAIEEGASMVRVGRALFGARE